MDLEYLETVRQCAPRARFDGVEAGISKREGRRLVQVERDRAECDNWPTAFSLHPQVGGAGPGRGGAHLAAGVREVNPRDGALAIDIAGDARQGFDVRVAPDAEVAWSDAASQNIRKFAV